MDEVPVLEVPVLPVAAALADDPVVELVAEPELLRAESPALFACNVAIACSIAVNCN